MYSWSSGLTSWRRADNDQRGGKGLPCDSASRPQNALGGRTIADSVSRLSRSRSLLAVPLRQGEPGTATRCRSCVDVRWPLQRKGGWLHRQAFRKATQEPCRSRLFVRQRRRQWREERARVRRPDDSSYNPLCEPASVTLHCAKDAATSSHQSKEKAGRLVGRGGTQPGNPSGRPHCSVHPRNVSKNSICDNMPLRALPVVVASHNVRRRQQE